MLNEPAGVSSGLADAEERERGSPGEQGATRARKVIGVTRSDSWAGAPDAQQDEKILHANVVAVVEIWRAGRVLKKVQPQRSVIKAVDHIGIERAEIRKEDNFTGTDLHHRRMLP